MKPPKHPTQPLILDENNNIRFKANAIVRFLLDVGPHDMSTLAVHGFSVEDREQFAQLIGYSLCGFSELSYVTDETYKRADRSASARAVKAELDRIHKQGEK